MIVKDIFLLPKRKKLSINPQKKKKQQSSFANINKINNMLKSNQREK